MLARVLAYVVRMPPVGAAGHGAIHVNTAKQRVDGLIAGSATVCLSSPSTTTFAYFKLMTALSSTFHRHLFRDYALPMLKALQVPCPDRVHPLYQLLAYRLSQHGALFNRSEI